VISTYLKFGAGALLFGLWTLLVWSGHADAGLIDAIKYALGTLGLYHAVSSLQAAIPPAPAAAPPAPAPTVEQIAAALAAVVQQPNVVVNVPSKPTPKEPV
jgi:hypothetical protein